MSWLRVDDKAAFNRKVLKAGNEAFGALIRMGCWSADHLTDGVIPVETALLVASEDTIERLCGVGFLERKGEDYIVHNYLEYNPSADQIRSHREETSNARREAGKRGASNRWHGKNGKTIANGWQTDGKGHGKSMAPSQSHTHPNPEEKDPEASTKPPDKPAEAAQGKLELAAPVSPPAKHEKATRHEMQTLIGSYQQQWVENFKPVDGQFPVLSKADKNQAASLIRKFGLEEALDFVWKYLSDSSPYLVERGHPLALIDSRVNGYRARASPKASASGWQRPATAEELGEPRDATDEL